MAVGENLGIGSEILTQAKLKVKDFYMCCGKVK
jgi:hypothetical protein